MPVKLPSDLKRIAVFRALYLGDLLCAIPALRALRTACPNAEITLIGLPGMADLARRFGAYIDSFASFPGIPGLPEQAFDHDAFLHFLERERAERYDLLLQMHGKGSVTNPLVAMLGARHLAGFHEPGAYCPDSRFFMPYPEALPEVRRHLRLMQFLGIEAKGEALEFPVSQDEWSRLDALAARHGFSGQNYVCIHPGARDMRRWWAPEKFARVADLLVEKGNCVVFTGTDDERDAVESVRQRMTGSSINLVGETDLGLLGALIGRARLLVSNDTGVSHVAAALGTPSVIIFLTSDPARWAPLDADRHQVVHSGNAADIDNVIVHVERALRSPLNAALR